MRWALIVCVLALGCEPIAPQSVRDVHVPGGFALQTSRSVHLAVQLDAPLRARAPWVTIALSDGRLLVEGVQGSDTVYDLRLPAGQSALRVTARVDGAVVDTRDLTLDPGLGASVRLGGAR